MGRRVRVRLLTVSGAVLVVVVLAVLLHAMLPGPSLWRSCQSNLKQIVLGLQMYMDDYAGRLPSSLLRNPHATKPDAAFECSIGDWGHPSRRSSQTLASVLGPYIKTREIMFCPSDPIAPSEFSTPDPEHLTSYIYRPAVDMAAMHGATQKDFAYPAVQMVLFERLPFHLPRPRWWEIGKKNPLDIGWGEDAERNMAFMDGHVDYRKPAPGTASGVPGRDIPDAPGPALTRVLNIPGWPCWYNLDAKTESYLRAKAYDPKRYRDDLR